MSHHSPVQLLVCYDIRKPKRLRRVHRCMCQWGLPLQYSVFYCYLTPKSRQRMENELRQLINPKRDDIRIYGIRSSEQIQFIGKQPMPAGMGLLGLARL